MKYDSDGTLTQGGFTIAVTIIRHLSVANTLYILSR